MGATGQWIPWQDRQEWSQVVESITTAVAGLGGEVEHLREIARQIEDWYAKLEDLLDNLGAITCCSCTTICCTMATVWYDLRDLLFLYLANNRLPATVAEMQIAPVCISLPMGVVSIAGNGRLFALGISVRPKKKTLLCENNMVQAKRFSLLSPN